MPVNTTTLSTRDLWELIKQSDLFKHRKLDKVVIRREGSIIESDLGDVEVMEIRWEDLPQMLPQSPDRS